MKFYAGIGSRATPPELLPFIQYLADAFRRADYVLRSGHAVGADQAFEAGAGAAAEIYLPWPKYEQGVAPSAAFVKGEPSGAALVETAKHHPDWDACSKAVRMMHARNAHIILGRDLKTPVSFVVCWTPDAAGVGGSGQAIRIARAHGIEVFDLADPEVRGRLERFESTIAELPRCGDCGSNQPEFVEFDGDLLAFDENSDYASCPNEFHKIPSDRAA